MENKTNLNTLENIVWKPLCKLRWLETDLYNPVNDSFVKILQQQWVNDKGKFKWESIETVSEY